MSAVLPPVDALHLASDLETIADGLEDGVATHEHAVEELRENCGPPAPRRCARRQNGPRAGGGHA